MLSHIIRDRSGLDSGVLPPVPALFEANYLMMYEEQNRL